VGEEAEIKAMCDIGSEKGEMGLKSREKGLIRKLLLM
jgi:hypothetical protein